MDVDELRPRHVIDEEDDQVQVLSNSNVQDDTNQASTSGSHDIVQDQLVASTSSQPNNQASASNQVPMLQTTNIARDHPLNTIIGDISRGVQTRLRLASFCEHFSFVSSIEPIDGHRAVPAQRGVVPHRATVPAMPCCLLGMTIFTGPCRPIARLQK